MTTKYPTRVSRNDCVVIFSGVVQESECIHKTIASKTFFMFTKRPLSKEFTSASVSSMLSMLRREEKNIVFRTELEPRLFYEKKHTWGMLSWNCLKSSVSWCCCTSSSPLFQVLLHKLVSFLVLHKLLLFLVLLHHLFPLLQLIFIKIYFFAGLSSWPCYVVFLRRLKILIEKNCSAS